MKKKNLPKKKASGAKPKQKTAWKVAKTDLKKVIKNEPDIKITSTGGGLE